MTEKVKEIRVNAISELPDDKIQIKIDDLSKPEFDAICQTVDSLLLEELPSKR